MVSDPLTRIRAEERVARVQRNGFIIFGTANMTDLGARIFEFSTDELAEQDRIAFWREHFGHVMLRVDIEPTVDQAFIARSRTLAPPGSQLMEVAPPHL